MPGSETFLESPEGTREEIMRATYLALCQHGYSGITIDRIGEKFPKSKSLIYHHYDGKDDLLLDFLEFVIEQFEDTMAFEEAGGADDQLEAILDHVFATPLPEGRSEFARAMVELRAQAAHDEGYRVHFSRHDRFFVERIADIIESGIHDGVFAEVDPEAVARFLVTVITGSMTQRVTSRDDEAPTVRSQVDTYLRETLLEEAG